MANSKNEAAAKVEETKAAETTKAAKEEETRAAEKDGLEEIYIPRSYTGDDPNLFVSVNGKNFLLPRGKKSKVPPHVAYEIKRSLKAQEILDQHIDEMKSKSTTG